MPDVYVDRKMTADEAAVVIGDKVQSFKEPNVPKARENDPVFLIDRATNEVVGIVTKLPQERLRRMRAATLGIDMGTVARMGGRQDGSGRTFGWSPKRVVARRENCRAASSAVDHPAEHAVLTEAAGWMTGEFEKLLPARAENDHAVLRAVMGDWLLDENALWTSGVINKSAQLPYHRDGSNFHTWSAMPSLRWGMDGGYLHVPEYGIVFRVDDGDVTWFCGRDLVHGVTPMTTRKKGGYRYTVVYYALAGMKDCRTYAEETAAGAQRRTEREQKMARELHEKMSQEVGA
jgi:hypothetical protein